MGVHNNTTVNRIGFHDSYFQVKQTKTMVNSTFKLFAGKVYVSHGVPAWGSGDDGCGYPLILHNDGNTRSWSYITKWRHLVDFKLLLCFTIASILYCQLPGDIYELLNAFWTGLCLLSWRSLFCGTMVESILQPEHTLAPLHSGLLSSLVSAHTSHRDNLSTLCETHFFLDPCSSLINPKEAKRINHLSPIIFP